MGIESIFVCNRRIREEIQSRAVLAFAELRSGTVLDIMPREASPAEGRFVQTALGELVFWIRATRITMLKLSGPPCKECVLSIRFTSTLAHRITPHLDPRRIVDQPVEDAVSQCGIADLLVPA